MTTHTDRSIPFQLASAWAEELAEECKALREQLDAFVRKPDESLDDALARTGRFFIEQELARSGGDVEAAAAALGLTVEELDDRSREP